MGQMQLGQNMDLQKNPADSARQKEHGNAPTTLQLTHDPTTNAKITSQGTNRAVRDPPLGEGHEQPDADTEEQGIRKSQPRPGQKFSADPVLLQKLGSAGLMIPTHKRASDQPGALYAASNMGGNEMASSIIVVRGRHSPPPRQDLTTHAMPPTLQWRNDPTKPVSTVFSSRRASLGLGTPITQPLDQDGDAPIANDPTGHPPHTQELKYLGHTQK